MFPPNKDDPPLAVFPKTEAPNVGLMLELSSLLLEENIPEGFGLSEELPAKIEAEFDSFNTMCQNDKNNAELNDDFFKG